MKQTLSSSEHCYRPDRGNVSRKVRIASSSGASLLAALSFAGALPSANAIENARQSDSFVDSIGVNVHLYSNDVAYWNFDGITKPLLLDLGVRHVRAGMETGLESGLAAKYESLAASGIKTCMIISDPANLVTIANNCPTAIEFFEGPNEVNNSPGWNYLGVGFPVGLRNFMTALNNNVKNYPPAASIPVIGPSLVGGSAYTTLGPVACDIGNMHSYQAGGLPDQGLYYNQMVVAATSGTARMVPTETGYYTLNDGYQGISELAHSKYIPRMFLENFRGGIMRTWAYEFIDEWSSSNPNLNNLGRESHWGLVKVSASGPNPTTTPKPAFTVLKNLIALLKDPGAPFTPGSLDYSISGTNQKVLRHILVQKRDGSFWLVLWQNVSNFTPSTFTDLFPAAQSVTVTFNQTVTTAKTYLPNTSQSVVNTYNNPTSLALSVSDVPLLVQLTGIGAQSGTTKKADVAMWGAADGFMTTVSPFTTPDHCYVNFGDTGRIGDKGTIAYRQILKFDLPPIAAGQTVGTATLTFKLVSKLGAPTHNVELVSFESALPNVAHTDWADSNRLTALGVVLTSTTPVGGTITVNSAALSQAVRNAYSSGRTYLAFRFQLPSGVFLTGTTASDYYSTGGIVHNTPANRPTLTFTTSPVTTLTVTMAATGDGALTAASPYLVATTLLATGSTAHVGSHNDNKAYQTYYKFTLPTIPAGKTIAAARLNFHANTHAGTPTNDVVLATYEPASAALALGDWTNTTNGTELGTLITLTTPSGDYEVNSGVLNQAIVDAYGRSSANFGFRLKLANGAFLGGAPGLNTYYSVTMQENGTVTSRPTLDVDYY